MEGVLLLGVYLLKAGVLHLGLEEQISLHNFSH